MDKQEVVITATKDQINEFKGSLLWADIKRELKSWLERFAGQKGDTIDLCIEGEITGSSALTGLADIRGREKAIDYILEMPDVFLSILEDKKDESRRK